MSDAIDAAAEDFIDQRVGLADHETRLVRKAFRAGAVAGLRYVVERMYDGAVEGAAPYWLDDIANSIEAGEEPL